MKLMLHAECSEDEAVCNRKKQRTFGAKNYSGMIFVIPLLMHILTIGSIINSLTSY